MGAIGPGGILPCRESRGQDDGSMRGPMNVSSPKDVQVIMVDFGGSNVPLGGNRWNSNYRH